LMLGLSEPANIDWERSIETHSNLSFKNLSEILCLLGLDDKEYSLKQQLLDQKLLQKRNLIAHGQQAEIDLDDYSDLHDEILRLLDMFRNDVENAAAREGYRAVSLESSY
jgi:hypothetical protein